MTTNTPIHRLRVGAFTLLLAFASISSYAVVGFSLPATSSSKLDLGLYTGGSVLSIQISGQISLISGWDTYADGSLVHSISSPLEYRYANAAASGYPTLYGGDGINHFAGGGANFDVNSGTFGFVGPQTTDTTIPSAIRFGAVVGTFEASPARGDWFLVGTSDTVVVPSGGAHLYLAINDSTYPNNSGSYVGNVTVVPEPTVMAFGLAALLAATAARRGNRAA